MSMQSVGARLVAKCNAGENFEVMRTMYDPGIVSVESGGEETTGQAAVIKKSERWAAGNTIHGSTVRGPYFNGPEEFSVMFSFEVTPTATGKRVTKEEVAVYTVKEDKITRERFFNAGGW